MRYIVKFTEMVKSLDYESFVAFNPNCALEKLKRFLSIAPSFSWGFINIMDWL
jgi:hypothetical protein